MIDWLYYLLLLLGLLAGLFLNLLGLPGLWLMVLGHIVYGLATGWGVYVGWESVLVLTALALVAEVVEFIAGAAGSKSAGSTKRGMVGAIAGGVIGGIVGQIVIPIPVIGAVVGAVAGSFIGTWGVEMMIHRNLSRSNRAGLGAAKGRLYGIVAKSCFGVVMLAVSMLTALPTDAWVDSPHGPADPPHIDHTDLPP